MGTRFGIGLGWIVLLALAGCAAQVGEPGAIDDGSYTETVVHIHEDGTESVEVHEVEAAPYDDDELGLASEDLSRDTGCAGASIWLYDQPNRGGNRICFHHDSATGPARVSLDNSCSTFTLTCTPGPTGIPSCRSTCVPWSRHVRSLWAGDDAGFVYSTIDYNCRDHFGTYGQINSMSCNEGNGLQLGTAARLVDVYRLFKGGEGHFYTADPAERDYAVTLGFVREGTSFRCWNAPVVGSTPLYRLWSPPRSQHIYTTDAGYRSSLLSSGWHDEGILCHAMDGTHGYGPECALTSTMSEHHTDQLLTLLNDEARMADACFNYEPEIWNWAFVYAPTGYTTCFPPAGPAIEQWNLTRTCPGTSPAPTTPTVRSLVTPAYFPGSAFYDGRIPFGGSWPSLGTIDGDLQSIRAPYGWEIWLARPGSSFTCNGSAPWTSSPDGFITLGAGRQLEPLEVQSLFYSATPSLRTLNAVTVRGCAMPATWTGQSSVPLEMMYTARY